MHKVVDQYNAFKLNEYQGSFEVVGGNEGKDGKFYTTWVIVSEYDSIAGGGVPATKKDGSYRNIPIKIVLGSREEAIANLKWLLGQLEEHEVTPSDIPF
ncbi:MAG: hypothetical protein IMY71_00580 [Bacteroidetes bacterium]|nr:hypothetical protein [Bacteroidota bacterium]